MSHPHIISQITLSFALISTRITGLLSIRDKDNHKIGLEVTLIEYLAKGEIYVMNKWDCFDRFNRAEYDRSIQNQ